MLSVTCAHGDGFDDDDDEGNRKLRRPSVLVDKTEPIHHRYRRRFPRPPRRRRRRRRHHAYIAAIRRCPPFRFVVSIANYPSQTTESIDSVGKNSDDRHAMLWDQRVCVVKKRSSYHRYHKQAVHIYSSLPLLAYKKNAGACIHSQSQFNSFFKSKLVQYTLKA